MPLLNNSTQYVGSDIPISLKVYSNTDPLTGTQVIFNISRKAGESPILTLTSGSELTINPISTKEWEVTGKIPRTLFISEAINSKSKYHFHIFLSFSNGDKRITKDYRGDFYVDLP